MGRRLAFNTTLFLAGVFGLAVGGGPSWVGTCGLYAACKLGFFPPPPSPSPPLVFLPLLPLLLTPPKYGSTDGKADSEMCKWDSGLVEICLLMGYAQFPSTIWQYN